MSTREKQIATQAEQWWKDHVATYETFKTADGSEIEYLRWGARDGSRFYLVHFYMLQGRLMVTGDMYCATFHFSHSWKMKDVFESDSYYFMRALESGPHGRNGTEWDADVAKAELKSILADEIKEKEREIELEAEDRLCRDTSFPTDPSNDEWAAGMKKYKEIVREERESNIDPDDPFECLQSENDWSSYLETKEAEERFGGDQWLHLGIGQTTAYCHIWQYHAFKEAMKQLQAVHA